LRREIDAAVLAGNTWEEVAEIVDSCPLNEDVRAALWLYGWGSLERSGRAPTMGTADALASPSHSGH
jgi:hypothetical protein